MVGVYDVRKYKLDNRFEMEVNRCRDMLIRGVVRRNKDATRIIELWILGRG